MIPIRPEEYQVWSRCLIDKAQYGYADLEQHVIRDRLAAPLLIIMHARKNPESTLQFWRGQLRDLSGETFDDFIKMNSEPARLERHLELPRPYILLTESESEELWQKKTENVSKRITDGWKEFHQRFPKSGGLVTLSRVGLDAAKSQAVVIFGVQAGGKMGYGEAILLRRDAADKWSVEGKHSLWIS